jgi:hypothetical protein
MVHHKKADEIVCQGWMVMVPYCEACGCGCWGRVKVKDTGMVGRMSDCRWVLNSKDEVCFIGHCDQRIPPYDYRHCGSRHRQ